MDEDGDEDENADRELGVIVDCASSNKFIALGIFHLMAFNAI